MFKAELSSSILITEKAMIPVPYNAYNILTQNFVGRKINVPGQNLAENFAYLQQIMQNFYSSQQLLCLLPSKSGKIMIHICQNDADIASCLAAANAQWHYGDIPL